MSLVDIENSINALTEASNNQTSASQALAQEVAGKMAGIDSKVSTKENEVDQFLQNATPETRYVQEIFIGGSKDYFYPVWWAFPSLTHGVSKITISRNYAENGSQRPLSNVSVHQAALLLEMEGNGNSWSGDANFLEIKRFFERYNSTVSHPNFSMYVKSEKANQNKPIYGGIAEGVLQASCRHKSGLYLRGGGLTYHVIKNWVGDVGVHDGCDQLRRNISSSETDDWSIRWYAEPIPFADLLKPEINVFAFSDTL